MWSSQSNKVLRVCLAIDTVWEFLLNRLSRRVQAQCSRNRVWCNYDKRSYACVFPVCNCLNPFDSIGCRRVFQGQKEHHCFEHDCSYRTSGAACLFCLAVLESCVFTGDCHRCNRVFDPLIHRSELCLCEQVQQIDLCSGHRLSVLDELPLEDLQVYNDSVSPLFLQDDQTELFLPIWFWHLQNTFFRPASSARINKKLLVTPLLFFFTANHRNWRDNPFVEHGSPIPWPAFNVSYSHQSKQEVPGRKWL